MTGFPFYTGPEYNDPEFSELFISYLQQSKIKRKITQITINTYNISEKYLKKLTEFSKPIVIGFFIEGGPVMLLVLNQACYEVAPLESVWTILGFTDTRIVERSKLILLKILASRQIPITINCWYLSRLISTGLNSYIKKHPEFIVPRYLRKVKVQKNTDVNVNDVKSKDKPFLVPRGGEVELEGGSVLKTVFKKLFQFIYKPKGSHNKPVHISHTGDSSTISINEVDPVKLLIMMVTSVVGALNADKVVKALSKIPLKRKDQDPYDSIQAICEPIGFGSNFGFLYRILIDEKTPDLEKKELISQVLSKINPDQIHPKEERVMFNSVNLDEIDEVTLLVECLLVLLTFLFPIDIRSYTLLLKALAEAYVSGRISIRTLKRLLKKLLEQRIPIPPDLEKYIEKIES